MAMTEFEIIKDYFSQLTQQRDDVVLGMGDDAAVLNVAAGKELVVSVDTLVEGVHFFSDVAPKALGYKSLAVNLSDMAAMGAIPTWFTLSLTMPEVNEPWLQEFCEGIAELATEYKLQLIGGDTCQGPLTISIQIHGLVEKGQAIRRDGAKPGDKIYVSGTLGDAAIPVRMRTDSWSFDGLNDADLSYLKHRLEYPQPKVALAQKLKPYASAAIDISDGLLADLTHLIKRSGCGANVLLADLPLSASIQKLARDIQVYVALSAGDDYELCFTVPPEHVAAVEALNEEISCIGEVTVDEQGGIRLFSAKNFEVSVTSNIGYQHFTINDDSKDLD